MKVGIIGAGITGLTLSRHLRARGVAHACLEAGAEPGGVIRSCEVEGRVLELGPQRLRIGPELAPLLEELGLQGEVLRSRGKLRLYVYFDGHLHQVPFSVTAFLATDLLSLRGKLRLLAEPLVRSRGNGQETVAEFFSRKFGREAYENFLGPLFGGIYGSDPRKMYAKYALARLLALEERAGSLVGSALRAARRGGFSAAITFRRGMQALPEALYERNHENVHLNTPVHGLCARERGYTLITSAGELDVDHVVITARADQAAPLLAQIAPEAPNRLARLAYNPLAVVHLHSAARHRGLGYQIRGDQDFHTLGVTWNSGTFERDGVFTCFLGGWKRADLLSRSDAELGQIARTEFEVIMDAPARVLHVHRWPRAIPAYDLSWQALDGLRLPPGIHLATNYTGGVGVSARMGEARALAGRFAGDSRPSRVSGTE